ncbi:tRNA (adenosine(37)-N6)-dimethylallyltransferase MiaA [Candidatus Uhrbacteria bacterium CG10_big_fil_rev_8_21_14_0_10_48_11]|uniref:tRNA dimethylallyltransferase n=1 Tax=Candidatus Uhrbacteria bacterium CG10_big_fil_rev_8_21_14_0_10_48_11 TaxID=1975037 RepID=A0A2M8LDX4_9BACT|nr:MAG: tRNA (adenosine(37)-N6)-dimethylallyltransferase MiaA [Candidatus Uhrbacteria bacterium CG10_big_fil_rev_8_21_14_0_10_48_11]
MSKRLPLLLTIVGPTASGKSDLAVHLARMFDGELVSADSRQVYRGMDVATAKLYPPAPIRQHLVDVVNPDELYSVQQFKLDAREAITSAHARGKLPILVGGTALFIYAVVQNWKLPEVPPNETLRKQLTADLQKRGLPFLVKQLEKLDPLAVAGIDVKNARRVIRAIEVASAIGNWFLQARKKGRTHYDSLKIGITVDTEILRERMKKRVEKMFQSGLVDETKKLLSKYPSSRPSMSGIGYPEVSEYLKGTLTKQECIEKVVSHTYQYSKRQMTWWKKDKEIIWVKGKDEAERFIKKWVAN